MAMADDWGTRPMFTLVRERVRNVLPSVTRQEIQHFPEHLLSMPLQPMSIVFIWALRGGNIGV